MGIKDASAKPGSCHSSTPCSQALLELARSSIQHRGVIIWIFCALYRARAAIGSACAYTIRHALQASVILPSGISTRNTRLLGGRCTRFCPNATRWWVAFATGAEMARPGEECWRCLDSLLTANKRDCQLPLGKSEEWGRQVTPGQPCYVPPPWRSGSKSSERSDRSLSPPPASTGR